MTEGRRERIERDIELLVCIRDRVKRIMDDEDHGRRGSAQHGYGSDEAFDSLSEACFVLLIAIDKLRKAQKR